MDIKFEIAKINRDKLKLKRELERLIFLRYYSFNELKCKCCNEKNMVFLVLDHINGKGTKQREEIGRGNKFYHWLITNDFPVGYQVLCHNCNWAKHRLGKCPHKET